MKQQILMIGGGTVFKGYENYLDYLRRYKIESLESLKYCDWKSDLEAVLGGEFEVIYLKMPCKRNAKYLEWKIWLEKLLPFLRNDIILIGHSLGGSFWLKYLAENSFPKKISQIHLVAAPVSNDKEFLGDFAPPEDLSNIAKLAKNIYLYYSQDDPVVPFSELQKISSKLPSAKAVILQNYDHFRIKEFPELIERIKGFSPKIEEKQDSVKVDDFLDKKNVFAVVGVSQNPAKYGHQVYKDLKEAGYRVYPVNPNTDKVLGNRCYRSLSELPEKPDVVNTVVQPKITEKIVMECKRLGIKKVWMQPGSESEKAIRFCNENGIETMHDVCVMIKRRERNR